MASQDQLKKEARQQILLTVDKLDPRIVQQLKDMSVNVLAPLRTLTSQLFLDTITVVDQIL